MVGVMERVVERVNKGVDSLIEGKELIDLAKRAGIDVTKQETRLLELEEDLSKITKAVEQKQLKKK